MDDPKEVLRIFEADVVAFGVSVNSRIATGKQVPIKPGALSRTKYATFLGRIVETDLCFAVDYYGYYKLSRGLYRKVEDTVRTMTGVQVRSIKAKVVHFNSIKVVDLCNLGMADFVHDFVRLKDYLLKLRGFRE